MKKLITILTIGLFTFNSYAQCAGELAQGCVGACSDTSKTSYISYTVTASDVAKTPGGKFATICLSVLSNSLCPSTGAEAIVTLGRKTYKVDLSTTGSILIRAKAGDVINVYASLYSTMKEIYCIWQGELRFGLGLN